MEKILLLNENKISSEKESSTNMDEDLKPLELQMPPEQEENDKTQVYSRVSGRKTAHEPSLTLKDYYVYSVEDIINELDNLLNFKETIKAKDSSKWLKTMKDKINSINMNGVWDLTDLLRERKATGCKCVFRKSTSQMVL